jgi:hypothetical protein
MIWKDDCVTVILGPRRGRKICGVVKLDRFFGRPFGLPQSDKSSNDRQG